MKIMPRIVWKGCSHKPYKAPDEPLPPEAVKLEIPQDNFWMRAIFIASPLFLPVIASLYLKNYIAGYAVTNKLWIAIGLLTALSLSIVHEWLHCLPYPRTATAYIGILPTRFMAYMTCNSPISRTNEIISSLLPTLLGIIPWIIFLFCPTGQKEFVSFCWGLAIMGVTSPCPDYLRTYYVWKRVPKHAFVQTTSHGIYWFKQTSKQLLN